jgi:hypothetical protein
LNPWLWKSGGRWRGSRCWNISMTPAKLDSIGHIRGRNSSRISWVDLAEKYGEQRYAQPKSDPLMSLQKNTYNSNLVLQQKEFRRTRAKWPMHEFYHDYHEWVESSDRIFSNRWLDHLVWVNESFYIWYLKNTKEKKWRYEPHQFGEHIKTEFSIFIIKILDGKNG